MIKNLKITNHLGETLILELKFPEKSGFFIRGDGVPGLGPSKADINTSDLATGDGSSYNSARVEKRNVLFKLGFIENPTIEETRHKSYKHFPLKRRIKIEVETDVRITETYGYVESNEPSIFNSEEGSEISVICPDPYMYSAGMSSTEFSGIESLFQFPFSNESLSLNLINFGNILVVTENNVYYPGDVPVGVIMHVNVLGAVENLTIVHDRTQGVITIDDAKLITLTGSGLIAGDELVISTIKGSKYIKLIRNGVTINVLGSLDKYPSWFQLESGDNIFYYTADVGLSNLRFKIENQIAYEGI